ncbi:MAG: hypothetical protein J5671_00865 [Bacteroidaceae bacterium]|nr:hypothetical protein [Bacteroidaceae bacterium]
MKRLLIMALMVLGATTLSAQTRVGEVYNLPPVKYLNTELDGSITVRSYGEGKRKADARTQARKNAVYVIMFKGIQANGQTIRPLVTEANAYENHEAYFGEFFADKGLWKEFSSTKDEKLSAKEKMHGSTQNAFGSVVRVLRLQLKARLIADGIIAKE